MGRDFWESFLTFYVENPDKITLHVVLLVFVVALWLANGRRTKQLIQAKDREIERLAADNRRYREIYLKSVQGLSSEEYQQISAENVSDRLDHEG